MISLLIDTRKAVLLHRLSPLVKGSNCNPQYRLKLTKTNPVLKSLKSLMHQAHCPRSMTVF
jgi:hypothetical protein